MAVARATALGSAAAAANATALGGASLILEGDASATSAATSHGLGAATSSATASGGEGLFEVGHSTATANASAAGGGAAIAQAVATVGADFHGGGGAANATSNAESVKGALAQAQSTAVGSSGQAQSTATTSRAGVSVQSTAVAPTGSTATTSAIAQGGSGQAFVNPGQTAYAFSTALPDKAYAATLIDGASNVAGVLLGPRDVVFGTAILGANYASDGGGASYTYSASSTFDFGYSGDLMLGLIGGQQTGFAGGAGFQSLEFTIDANGVEILDTTFRSLAVAESFFHDDVIDWAPTSGPTSI
jgi:hypothetical protein